MDYYVYSTASCDNYYCTFKKTDVMAAAHIVDKKVLIKGGANISTTGAGNFVTPQGVVTKVTEAQMEILNNSKGFQRHLAAGFVTVQKVAKDPNIVARDHLQAKDGSAPITPKDTNVLGKATPKLNKE